MRILPSFVCHVLLLCSFCFLSRQSSASKEDSITLLWAAFLICFVGAFSALADIGASMFMMFAVGDDYGTAVTRMYSSYFRNGGISLSTTFKLFDFSFYFDFNLPSFSGVFLFKVIFLSSISLELVIGLIEFHRDVLTLNPKTSWFFKKWEQVSVRSLYLHLLPLTSCFMLPALLLTTALPLASSH